MKDPFGYLLLAWMLFVFAPLIVGSVAGHFLTKERALHRLIGVAVLLGGIMFVGWFNHLIPVRLAPTMSLPEPPTVMIITLFLLALGFVSQLKGDTENTPTAG